MGELSQHKSHSSRVTSMLRAICVFFYLFFFLCFVSTMPPYIVARLAVKEGEGFRSYRMRGKKKNQKQQMQHFTLILSRPNASGRGYCTSRRGPVDGKGLGPPPPTTRFLFGGDPQRLGVWLPLRAAVVLGSVLSRPSLILRHRSPSLLFLLEAVDAWGKGGVSQC
jgi:hypothetical protein